METYNAAKIALSELYESVGGDIVNVLERLEDIETVKTFVLEFEDDPSCSMLLQSLRENDLKSAFRAVHTLKGISYNLGFKRLGDCAANMCNELREGIPPSAISLRQLEAEYKYVISAIKKLQNCI